MRNTGASPVAERRRSTASRSPRRAVEVRVRGCRASSSRVGDEREERRELAEDEGAVALGERSRRAARSSASSLLGAMCACVGVDELGREAEHAQQRERAEHDEPVAVEVLEQAEHLLPLALQHRVVERAVRGAELDPHLLLLLGRQVGATSSFVRRSTSGRMRRRSRARRAARYGRRPPGSRAPCPARSGRRTRSRKRRADGKSPGAVERQQRPQLGQAVLERRAGDREGHVGAAGRARRGTPWSGCS